MTKEELREHCEKQVKACEMWAENRGQEPSGKIYEEHKLILDLIKSSEQEPILDKIRAEIMQLDYDIDTVYYDYNDMPQTETVHIICREEVLRIIDEYKAESKGGHEKLDKIEQIIKQHDNDSMPQNYWYIYKIKEVLEQE